MSDETEPETEPAAAEKAAGHPEPIPVAGVGQVQDNVSTPGAQVTHLPDGSTSEHAHGAPEPEPDAEPDADGPSSLTGDGAPEPEPDADGGPAAPEAGAQQ